MYMRKRQIHKEQYITPRKEMISTVTVTEPVMYHKGYSFYSDGLIWMP